MTLIYAILNFENYLYRMEVQQLVAQLKLQPHPEGGFFKETYRSTESIALDALPERFGGDRQLATAIYFLLVEDNFSAFHRIKADETWHFYLGQPIQVVEITPNGQLVQTTLGTELAMGQVPQYTVKAGHWFASHVLDWQGHGLVGCTVAPGFDFADFELAESGHLSALYPEHADIISKLTR